MEMDEALAVCFRNVFVINFAEPVVGGDGAGVGEDQRAHAQGDGGVFLHAPVFVFSNITVYQFFIVKQGVLGVTCLLMLFTV